jgi:hypothetical protein
MTRPARRGETVDETIDRIAAAMTAVPSDPGFAVRLDARLDAEPSRTALGLGTARGKALHAIAAAAAAIVVAVITRGVLLEHPAPLPGRPDMLVAAVDWPDVPLSTELVAPVAPASSSRTTRPRRRPDPDRFEPTVPQIAALAAPEALNVDDLSFTSLTIAPVELGHLDLANLEVRQLEAAGDPKEQ